MAERDTVAICCNTYSESLSPLWPSVSSSGPLVLNQGSFYPLFLGPRDIWLCLGTFRVFTAKGQRGVLLI